MSFQTDAPTPSFHTGSEPESTTADALRNAWRRLQSFSFRAAAFKFHPQLRRLERHVAANPGDPLTSREAARIAGQEESYFCRFFKAKVGVTYGQWHSFRRMERALKLLASYEASITAVAESCGFPDLRGFERHCLDWTDHTPRAIRELLRDAALSGALPIEKSNSDA